MRRKRRRPLWFPIIPTGEVVGEDGDNFAFRSFAITIAPGGATTVIIAPIIPDAQLDADQIPATTAGQLIQHLGNSYELERIVGKLFLGVSAPVDGGAGEIFPKTIMVGAGFFVARQADNSAGGQQDQPIGAAGAAEAIENYSPLSEDTMREPWIWHRTWILGTGRLNGNTAGGSRNFQNELLTLAGTGLVMTKYGAPSTNIGMPLMDGPHIDARSGRRVGGDERLFFAVAAREVDRVLNNVNNADAVLTDGLKGILQVRVLGWPRSARKRSAF